MKVLLKLLCWLFHWTEWGRVKGLNCLLICRMRPCHASWRRPRAVGHNQGFGVPYCLPCLARQAQVIMSAKHQPHPLGPPPSWSSALTSCLGLQSMKLLTSVAHTRKAIPQEHPGSLGNHLPTSAPLSAFPRGQGLMSILFPLTVSDCTQPWKPLFVPVALTNQYALGAPPR